MRALVDEQVIVEGDPVRVALKGELLAEVMGSRLLGFL